MITPTGLLTFEEFEQLPDKPGKQELLDGELIELPPAKKRHSEIAHRLFDQINRYLQSAAPHLRVYMEAGYRLLPRVYAQPDISVPHPDQKAGEYWEGSPLLAVEIISEANRAWDVQRKLVRYFEYGAAEVWLVYPAIGLIEVNHAGASVKHAAPFVSEVLCGLQIDPRALCTFSI